mgnify:FL=1
MSDFMKDMFIEVREEETKSQVDLLTEMIEDIVNVQLPKLSSLTEAERFSMSIPIPKLTPNESWGDPNSQSRKDIERIFASITRQPSVQARIQHVNSFVDPAQARRKGTGMRFNAILNMMMIIESLQACLNDYSESSAGFVFEGFMAAVTGGKQIAGRIGGTLPIEDFVTGDDEPVSLKLLSPKTPIHGSFTNLVDYLFIRGGSGEPAIKYLIGRKNSEGDDVSQLLLLDFIISRANFVEIMTATGNGDLLGPAAPLLEEHISQWQDSPEWRLEMLEILKQTPGYDTTRGMFYKNLDAEGEFNDAGSAPSDPELKRQDYAKEMGRTIAIAAQRQGFEDAQGGEEANFEGWMATQNLEEPDKRMVNSLKKAYTTGYQRGTTQQVAESYFGEFHEREKIMMREELNEAKGGSVGKQWSISAAGTQKIANIAGVEVYGELNMSNKNIKECAQIYIEKMGEEMMSLLETTKSFTENVGKYFSADRRSTAMNANKKAQQEGEQVVDLLAKSAEPATEEI